MSNFQFFIRYKNFDVSLSALRHCNCQPSRKVTCTKSSTKMGGKHFIWKTVKEGADAARLVSKVRVDVPAKPRRMKNPLGSEGRMDKLRKTLTGLVQHERLELNYERAQETRQYAERLISEAIRHGDTHVPTMETADFWLLDKQLVHKLFKVLAPRFQDCELSYTRLYKAPKPYPGDHQEKAILELRGNPYPNIKRDQSNRLLIHNALLDAAKQDYNRQKYLESEKTYTPAPEPTQEIVPDRVS